MKFQTRSLPTHAMHRDRAIALDEQCLFLGSSRKCCAGFGRRILDAAVADDFKAHLAGRTDHQLSCQQARPCAPLPARSRPGAGP